MSDRQRRGGLRTAQACLLPSDFETATHERGILTMSANPNADRDPFAILARVLLAFVVLCIVGSAALAGIYLLGVL